MKRIVVLLTFVFAFRSAGAALTQPVEADVKGLAKELAAATKSYMAATHEVEQLREKLKAESQVDEKVQTLTALVDELEIELVGKKMLADQYEGASAKQIPVTAELLKLLEKDPDIVRLGRQLEAANLHVSVLTKVKGKDATEIIEAQARSDAVAELLKSERLRKTLKYQEEQIVQAKQEFLDSQEQLLSLRDRLEKEKKSTKTRDGKTKQLRAAIVEAERLQTKIVGLVERIEKL